MPSKTENETKVVEIQKNGYETLRIERTEWQGVPLISVRAWIGLPGTGSTTPTKKGLSLRPAIWRQVLPAVEAILAEMEAEADADGEADTTPDNPA